MKIGLSGLNKLQTPTPYVENSGLVLVPFRGRGRFSWISPFESVGNGPCVRVRTGKLPSSASTRDRGSVFFQGSSQGRRKLLLSVDGVRHLVRMGTAPAVQDASNEQRLICYELEQGHHNP